MWKLKSKVCKLFSRTGEIKNFETNFRGFVSSPDSSFPFYCYPICAIKRSHFIQKKHTIKKPFWKRNPPFLWNFDPPFTGKKQSLQKVLFSAANESYFWVRVTPNHPFETRSHQEVGQCAILNLAPKLRAGTPDLNAGLQNNNLLNDDCYMILPYKTW